MEQITIEEALGKKLERVWHSGIEMVLFFDDQTWVHCSVERGYESVDDEIEFPPFGELTCCEMRDAGIITEEEHQVLRKQMEDKYAKQQERREKQQYERLRAKFEEKI